MFVHMIDSGNVATKLWEQWIPDNTKTIIARGISFESGKTIEDNDVSKILGAMASLHDIGKATPSFQSKLTKSESDLSHIRSKKLEGFGLNIKSNIDVARTPHALCSQAILERNGMDRSVAVVAGGHHGKPPSEDLKEIVEAHPNNVGFGTSWESVQMELLKFCCASFGVDLQMLRDCRLDVGAQVLITGLVIMSDWLASNEYYFHYQTEFKDWSGLHARADEAWNNMRMLPAWREEGPVDFKMRFSFDPRPIQSTVSDVVSDMSCPGLMLIEAPMGEGKTEAALMAAELLSIKFGMGGAAFALPTQATSDGIFPRMKSWIDSVSSEHEEHSLFLSHGKSHFNKVYRSLPHSDWNVSEDRSGAVVHEWFNGRKKGLLSDFVVCTVDQILMAGLKRRHLALRHLGLANKVVIIDECHAYDAYMGSYLSKVMEWFGAYRIPVILLSATLQPSRRKELFDAYRNIGKKHTVEEEWVHSKQYPLITYIDGTEIRQISPERSSGSKTVKIIYVPEDSLISSIEASSSNGGYIGIMMNTVERAQKMFRTLREKYPSDKIILLHSKFTGIDRTDIEADLMDLMSKESRKKPPFRMFVVGTQVIEQSLDLDFDLLYTDICPIDLLLQRIGRLHRHDNTRPNTLRDPICFVIDNGTGDFENGSEFIYGRFQLFNTRLLLKDRILIPDDITSLIHSAYSGSMLTPVPCEIEDQYSRAYEEMCETMKDKNLRAKNFQVKSPNKQRTLVGWLDNPHGESDVESVAAVRDTDDSLDVILIQHGSDGVFRMLPGKDGWNGEPIPADSVPSDDMSFTLAGCKVSLPGKILHRRGTRRVVSSLENVKVQLPPAWSKSSWLADEFFLVLDETMQCKFEGYNLTYDSIVGLEVINHE